MHLTLKQEVTKPASGNVLQQRARFDAFAERFNHERPHQALGMKVPADLYARSPRAYRGLEDLTYPFHGQTILVTHCGRICFKTREVNLSHVFAGQKVGVTQVGERIWLVTSCSTTWAILTMRHVGSNRSRIRSAERVTYVFGMNCHPCDRNTPSEVGCGGGI
jgi:hypothetical protein